MIYIVLISLAITGQLAAHYFPWKRLLHKDLPRPAAYIIGVAIMLTPYAVWLLTAKEMASFIGLVAAVLSSGLAVLAAYLFDAWLMSRAQAEIAKSELDQIKNNLS